MLFRSDEAGGLARTSGVGLPVYGRARTSASGGRRVGGRVRKSALDPPCEANEDECVGPPTFKDERPSGDKPLVGVRVRQTWLRACLDTIISCFFGERTREAKKSRQTPCDTVDYLRRGFSWRAEFVLKIKNRKSQPQSRFSASPRGPVAGSS